MNYPAPSGFEEQSWAVENSRKRKRSCLIKFGDASSPESGIDLDMASPRYHHERFLSSSTVRSQGGYTFQILEEPEQNYRARYESEGTRGPLKGQDDNHPAVKVCGTKPCNGRVHVQLVYEDGSEHGACSLDDSGERKNALVKEIGAHNNMTAVFDDLRIRREKKDTKQKTPGGRKQNKPVTVTSGRNDKVACLLFTAVLQQEGEKPITISVKSRSIILDTHQEPAELEWVKPSTASYHGGEEVVIKGTKMTSPKVIFILPSVTGSEIELSGSVDKDKSHQNIVVVKVPPLSKHVNGLAEKRHIFATVVVATGKGQLKSNRLHFTFLPDDVCPHCHQHRPSFSPDHIRVPSPPQIPCLQPIGNIDHGHIHPQIQPASFYSKMNGPTATGNIGLGNHGPFSFSCSPSQAPAVTNYCQDPEVLDTLRSLSSPESVSSHDEFFDAFDLEPEQNQVMNSVPLSSEATDVWQTMKDMFDQTPDLNPEGVQAYEFFRCCPQNTVVSFPLWVLTQFNSSNQ